MFDSSNHPHEGMKWNKQWSFTLMNSKHPIATTFEYCDRLGKGSKKNDFFSSLLLLRADINKS